MMRFEAFLLVFVITVRYVEALNITFSSSLTAAQNNTFFWTRDANDLKPNVWIRKQKLDDPTGATGWSLDFAMLDLTKDSGTFGLYFRRAGLFNIGVFKQSDDSRSPIPVPSQTIRVTVSLNPTSAGAILSTAMADSPLSTSSQVLPPSSTPKESSNTMGVRPQPDVALIVGLTLGLATLLVIIAAVILYFRFRRRRMTNATPESFQRDRMIRDADAESYMSYEKCDTLPPIQTIYSVHTDGSFSVTSPIAAAARERQQKRSKFLSFTTISSTSFSRSTTTRTRNSHITETSESPLPTLPPRTRTDRQMLVEEKIQLLQSKIIVLQGRAGSQAPLRSSVRPLPPLPPGSPSTFLPTTPTPMTPPSGDVQAEIDRLKRTVERMKEIHESDWALGLTNVGPEGLHD